MKPLKLRPLAEADLDGIWLHVAEDDPSAADALIDRFTETLALFREHPGMGAPTPELGPRAEGMLRRFLGELLRHLGHALLGVLAHLVGDLHGADAETPLGPKMGKVGTKLIEYASRRPRR